MFRPAKKLFQKVLPAIAALLVSLTAMSQDLYWVGNYYYHNDFNTQQQVNEWELTMLRGSGQWGPNGSGNATLVLGDDTPSFQFVLNLSTGGAQKKLALNKSNGMIVLDVAANDHVSAFELTVTEYDDEGNVIDVQLIIEGRASGVYGVGVSTITWDSRTTQIGFAIAGFTRNKNASIEFGSLSYFSNTPVTNWTDPRGWSTSPTGIGGAGVPTSSNDVWFTGAVPIGCDINDAIQVGSINFTSDFTGIVRQTSGPITVDRDMVINGGMLLGGYQDITVGGNIEIGGANFRSTARVLTVGGHFSVNSGTFDHSGGTVEFSTQNGTATITGNPVFNNVRVSGSGKVEITSAVTVARNLDLGGASTPLLMNGKVTISGSLTATGVSSGNLGNSSYEFTGGAAQVIDLSKVTGNVTLDAIVINKTAGTVQLATDLTVNNFENRAGQFSLGAKNLTVNNTLDITGGVFSITTGQVTMKGDLKNNGTFSPGTSTVVFDGATTISGSSITQLHNITLNGVLNAPAILNVSGNFKNDGNLNNGGGTIQFNGKQLQTISGTAVTDFNNMTISNSAVQPGVSVESDQNLRGVLTLSDNVHFDTDGSSDTAIFTLKSSADNFTQDAAVNILPVSASVTGKVTVERFMNLEGYNKKNIYRYISSPVQNAMVADIQNEIPVTGAFTGSSICSGCPKTASMFMYDETVITDTNGDGVNTADDGYQAFPKSSNTETLAFAKGYAMYVMGSKLTSATWNVRGYINQALADADLPMTKTSSGNTGADGWNLVGNPFPSTIDWNSPGWKKNNINATIYVRDNGGTAAQFASWNGVTGTNGGSRYIAMGQAFWVKGNGPGLSRLRADETVKVPGTQTIFFRESAPANLLRVTMTKDGVRDEAVIHFREDATSDFDAHADAEKMFNGTFNLSTILNNGKYAAINSMPANMCGVSVPLSVDYAAAGTYSLKFSEFESFIGSPIITLVDNFTGQQVNVLANADYTFQVTADVASKGKGRFLLTFDQAAPRGLELNTTPVCEGQHATVTLSNAQRSIAYVALINGNPASDTLVAESAVLAFNIAGTFLTGEVTDITIRSLAVGCIAATEAVIQVPVSQLPVIEKVQQNKVCQEGEVRLVAHASGANAYHWYNSADAGATPLEVNDSVFTTPFLSKSRTYWVAGINALGCEGPRYEITATITQYDNVTITAEDNILTSSYATGNQWYFENELIEGAATQTFQPTVSGNYGVSVEVDGCSTAADIHFLATTVVAESEFALTVYPNPVVDFVTIKVPAHIGKTARVYAGDGKPVGEAQLDDTGAGTFSFQSLPAGLYVVAAGKQTLKVVKE